MLVRRVSGKSMAPTLKPGRIVIGQRGYDATRRLKVGDIIIIKHDGLEKIKRVALLRDNEVYVLGDNSAASTDSRHFGWLPLSAVYALVVWPRAKP